MFVPLQAALSFGLSKAVSRKTLADAAERRVTIHPIEFQRVRPAIILPDAFDRVTNVGSENFPVSAFRSLYGELIEHAATEAYIVRDAQIYAGSVCAGRFRHHIRPARESSIHLRAETIDRIALCTTFVGDLYFGHFLNEDMQQMLLAAPFGGPARLLSKDWRDLAAYRRLCELDWREVAAARVRELAIFADQGQNANRRARADILRARMREKLTARKPGGRYYLRRGATGAARTPANDAEICAALKARGYDIIDLFTTDTEEFLENILDRSIIVSVEGSHMMHALYAMPEGGGALAIFPPDRACLAIKAAVDLMDGYFAITVGHAHETGFTVDISELEKTLDQLEARLNVLETV